MVITRHFPSFSYGFPRVFLGFSYSLNSLMLVHPCSECQPPGERDVGPLLVRKLDEVLVRQQQLDVSCGLYMVNMWIIYG